jgi:ATP-dependent Clp protease ATP-binding subunit ClpA
MGYSTSLVEVLNIAWSEVVGHKQHFIAEHHLLLALAQLDTRPAGQLLIAMGATVDKLRVALTRAPEPDQVEAPSTGLPVTTAVRQALDSAASIARACRAVQTQPEDLLLVLLADQEGIVVTTLARLGVDMDRLGESLEALPRHG